MKGTGLLLIGVAGAIIAGSLYRKYNAANKLTATVLNVIIDKLELLKSHLYVTIAISNNSTEVLEFNRFVANITSQGQLIAEIDSANSMDKPFALKPGSNEFSFGVWISNIEAVNFLLDTVLAKKNSITVDGVVTVGVIDLPVKKVIEFDLKNKTVQVSGCACYT